MIMVSFTWKLQHVREKIIEAHGILVVQNIATMRERVWVRRDNINSCQCKIDAGIKDWHCFK